jgi:hypothetical protein
MRSHRQRNPYIAMQILDAHKMAAEVGVLSTGLISMLPGRRMSAACEAN